MRFYKALRPIRALSFDLDDTLYHNIPFIKDVEEWFSRYLTARYGLPDCCSAYAFWEHDKDLIALSQPELKNDVTYLRAKALTVTFARLQRVLPIMEALELVQIFIKKRSQVPVPESSLRLLDQLKSRVPLIALSNGNVCTQTLGLDHYFCFDLRPGLSPHQLRKPYPDLFQQAAQRLGVPLESILHVGDEPLSDVHGAVGAGCQCAWLKGGVAGRSSGIKNLLWLPTVELDDLAELLLIVH